MTALAPTLQAFFTDRLIRQRQASPHTIAAYRDTCRLLLAFVAARTGKPPTRLDIADLDAPLIAAFLDHLEADRGNSVRTRNARLAAIHSLFGYAALATPNTPPTSPGCWPSRRNASTRPSSPSSPTPKSTPCSPHPTAPPGPGAATTPCCCSPSRPACASPN